MFKFMARRLSRSEEGFTLIELLVVVAIIALLATFAVPKLFDAINKSKKAPGQADIDTISGALERYYMDKNKYPLVGSVKADLTAAYLKSTTTFYNGYKNGYMYVTDANGSFYILIDAQKKDSTTALSVKCGTNTDPVTPGNKDISAVLAITIVAADLPGGCKVGTVSGGIFTELPDNSDTTKSYSVVTN